MKVTTNIIQETVKNTVGEDVLPLVQYLKDRKNISEFKIAEKLGTEVNQTRNMLYRLHTHHLVTYHKKKDKQKGWYISYWTFNAKRVKDLMINNHNRALEKLKERVAREEKHHMNFFICPSFCVRVVFEQAASMQFKCPECSKILQQQDNSKTIENLKGQIGQIEALMKQKSMPIVGTAPVVKTTIIKSEPAVIKVKKAKPKVTKKASVIRKSVAKKAVKKKVVKMAKAATKKKTGRKRR